MHPSHGTCVIKLEGGSLVLTVAGADDDDLRRGTFFILSVRRAKEEEDRLDTFPLDCSNSFQLVHSVV